MLAILVLGVLILIVLQITLGSSVDMRVAQNDLERTKFDAAIESAMLKTMQDLADDAAAGSEAGAGAAGGAAGGAPDPGGFGSAAGGAGGDEATGPVDSRRDDWARPQQTEINGVSLRILIQDEDSKYNVLTMLTEDEAEAEQAFNRVVRVLDQCREGTLSDIDEAEARNLAEEMRDFMRERDDAVLPRPTLLTDREDMQNLGMPLTLRDFVVLPGFDEFMFRDYRDAKGTVVHSIGSFLTVSTSVQTYDEYQQALSDESTGSGNTPAPGVSGGNNNGGNNNGGNNGGGNNGGMLDGSSGGGGGGGPGFKSTGNSSNTSSNTGGSLAGTGNNGGWGIAVNLNTASNAVLHSLADRRDVSWDFLDSILRYRNEEDEEASGSDSEPVYDEYGEEIITKQIFESVDEIEKVDGWDMLEPDAQADFKRFLTVESRVFSVFITARASLIGGQGDGAGMTRAESEEAAEKGTDRVRTVRAILWRYSDGEEVKIVPLEAWEVLDYVPFEVLDFPEEER